MRGFAYNYFCTLDTSTERNSIVGELKICPKPEAPAESFPLVGYDVLPVFGEYAVRELRLFPLSDHYSNSRYSMPTYENIRNFKIPV
jgi:hypothetical protein